MEQTKIFTKPDTFKFDTGIDDKTKEDILKKASAAYGVFLTSLGFDWKNDVNMQDTPMRVAKSFVNDLWAGLYQEEPNITSFENSGHYDGMVFCGNITLNSVCSHHALPFIGVAHVAYIPAADGKIIGLSKLNRIVEYYSRRPQVQENLTAEIHKCLDNIITSNEGVAVVLEAKHLCSCVRGVKHDSTMMTSKISGQFNASSATREEFYDFINRLK